MTKTFLLLAGMTAFFMVIGNMLGGTGGMLIALGFAAVTNAIAYWFSGTMVLKRYRARPVDEQSEPGLHRMVAKLASNAGIPIPKVYLVNNPQPNAFATGRNPEHGAVAVTTGLMEMLDERELTGVVAHELAHIKNRDTLIMTVTATIAGAIGSLAKFAMFFGGSQRKSRFGPIGMIAVMIFAPMAAMIVQFAISRTREYAADKRGAQISGDPIGLALALEKISGGVARIPNIDAENNPASAHVFIANPLHMHKADGLFSTHPAAANRIKALHEMAQTMNGSAPTSSSTSTVQYDTASHKGTFGF